MSYIQRCMNSLLIQDELSEIIFIDGGSTDGSYERLIEIADHHDRVKTLTHPNRANKGVSASRNLGIQHAQGDWITFCDIDDYFLAGRFEAFAKADKEGIDLYHTTVKADYEDESLRSSIQEVTTCPKEFVTPQEMQDHLITSAEESISIISIIVRKDVLLDVGLFDEDLVIGEDTDLIWRMAGKAKFRYEDLTPPRVIRQVHQNNTYQNREKLLSGRAAFYRKWRSSQMYETLTEAAKKRIRESYRYYTYIHGVEYGNAFSQSTHLIKYLWDKLLKT